MSVIKSYRDLLKEIEIYKNRLEDLEREDYALNRIEKNRLELDIYMDRKIKRNNEAAILQAIIDDKKETVKEIESKINKLEGLEYKIAYMRYIEGMRLKEIADELGYSYQYIREVAVKPTLNLQNENKKVL